MYSALFNRFFSGFFSEFLRADVSRRFIGRGGFPRLDICHGRVFRGRVRRLLTRHAWQVGRSAYLRIRNRLRCRRRCRHHGQRSRIVSAAGDRWRRRGIQSRRRLRSGVFGRRRRRNSHRPRRQRKERSANGKRQRRTRRERRAVNRGERLNRRLAGRYGIHDRLRGVF